MRRDLRRWQADLGVALNRSNSQRIAIHPLAKIPPRKSVDGAGHQPQDREGAPQYEGLIHPSTQLRRFFIARGADKLIPGTSLAAGR
jgi:hypothetical protein